MSKAKALVVRTRRHKRVDDKNSPMVFTLRRKSKDAKILDLECLAADIEALGGMSAEDVVHVGKAIARQMRQTLTDGNNVRLDGFGIFHTTFKCRATEAAKDCTVKNIEKVNIRFKVANTLRLENDTNATTKGNPNTMVFELVSEDKADSGSGSGSKPGGNTGGGDDDQEENPLG
ncbi:MAG: DNA-binding protein [Bacteroides sp.]|nr:DNA-binding protein [Bacteroides sp.]